MQYSANKNSIYNHDREKTKTQAAFLSETGSDLFAAAAERLSSAILA